MRQRIWKNSKMESWRSDGAELCRDWPCEVTLENRRIEVRYEDHNGGMSRYVGKDNGSGNFFLQGTGVSDVTQIGRGNLRFTTDNRFLEGDWFEEGDDEGWSITLE
jgi:hypothetical protein